MIDTKHLLKVISVWVSMVYVICYVGVAIYPPIRSLFMQYALHTDTLFASNLLGGRYFISGLIVWNIVAVSCAWLFAILFNTVRR